MRRAAIPGPHYKAMGPNIWRAGASTVYLRLKESHEVHNPVVVPGVGNSIGAIVIEIAPHCSPVDPL
jgi:hypothetical protein